MPLLWHEFAVGLAVYWRFHGGASLTGKRVVDLTLVSLALASWFNRLYLPLSPVSDSTIAAALFGLLLIALKRFDPIASQLRVLAPLRACGRRCYSIYLVHLPVCTIGNLILITRFGLTSFWMRVLVVMPVVTAAALGCSWLFFYLIERHFLNPSILPQGRPVLLSTVSEPLAGEAPA